MANNIGSPKGIMIINEKKLIEITQFQVDQIVGKETVLKKELSYAQLVDLISNIPRITKSSIGKMEMTIITKIVSGHSTLYCWYDNKFTGL